MSGINNFAKKYFHSTNLDNTNFHHFLRSVPVDIPSKIQFSKNRVKLWRNTSFDEWNK